LAKVKVNKKRKIQKPAYIEPEENKIYNYVLIFLFAVLLFFFTSFKITGDDDVFWHLATGRYILQTGEVPSTDIFGWMTQGVQWMPFEWGWDVITYLIYSASGFVGLSLFRTLIIFLIFLIFFVLLRKFKVSHTLIFIFFNLLLIAVIDRVTPRPHLMSYLFFALLVYIICDYRYINRNNFKKLFFIPLIFFLWGNLHMGILAGLMLFGVYVLAELIMFKYQKSFTKELLPLKKPDIVRLLLIFLAVLIVLLINPNMIETYLYAYEHTKMKLLETVNEWRSPFDSKYYRSFVTMFYIFFLASGVLILYYSFRKKDYFPALLYLVFGFYSVQKIRYTVDYNLILFVFIVLSVAYIIDNLKTGKFRYFVNKSPALKIIVSAYMLFCIYSLAVNFGSRKIEENPYLKYLSYYRVSGFGINDDFIPVQMFDFLKQNNIPEIGDKVFNHFGTGGFFIWNFPGKQNFIDSRNLNDDIFNKYREIIGKLPGFEKKLDNYGVEYIIYLEPDMRMDPENLINRTFISALSVNNDWKLVFWDDKSMLFLKNIDKFKDIISQYEYKYLTPYNIVFNTAAIDRGITADKQKIKTEFERKMQTEPEGIFIRNFEYKYKNKLN